MPTYAYACKQCAHRFETVQSFAEPSLTVCPECGGALRKQYGSIGVTFNGAGFYRTDSRAGEKKRADAKSGDSDGGSSGDTKGGSGGSKSESGGGSKSDSGSGSKGDSGSGSKGDSGSGSSSGSGGASKSTSSTSEKKSSAPSSS